MGLSTQCVGRKAAVDVAASGCIIYYGESYRGLVTLPGASKDEAKS